MSRAAALIACATLALGCTNDRTQVRIAIFTEGVRVPDDVARIHLTVSDREPGATDAGAIDDAVYDQEVALCTGTPTPGCYDLPLSAVLFPGPKRAGDTVKVEVLAIGPLGLPVTSDAALFVFSPHQSFQLDFVLYANCLGVTDCADRDQTCGPDAQCQSLTPVKGGSTPDLSGGAGSGDDLSMSGDMTGSGGGGGGGGGSAGGGGNGEDMSKGKTPEDLAPPPPDMACLVACSPGEVCDKGICTVCGNLGGPCCDTAPMCVTGSCIAGKCSSITSIGDMQVMTMPGG